MFHKQHQLLSLLHNFRQLTTTTRGKIIVASCFVVLLLLFLLFSGKSNNNHQQQQTTTLQQQQQPIIVNSNSNNGGAGSVVTINGGGAEQSCSIRFLIMTAPRPNLKNHGKSPYFYLEQTVDSILELEGEFFKPCISLLNVKGVKNRKDLETMQKRKSGDRIEIIDQLETESLFTSVLLPQKKKQHLNDFYSIMNLIKTKYVNDFVMLMEDDFVFCPKSVYHISYILTEMEKRKWSGVRISFGLNGVILKGGDLWALTEFLKRHSGRATPVDWLLEEFWNQHDQMGENYFNERKFFTYRLQLMTHIGYISTVGNERPGSQNDLDFPHCFEAQIHSKLMFSFEMDRCPHSMFSPCDESYGGGDGNNKKITNSSPFPVHDIIEESIQTASANFSLSTLKHSFKAIHCRSGESCTTCCSRNGQKCSKEFFPFINQCKELAKYNPNCKCEREKYILSRAPHTFQGFCFISTRRSRFDCNSSKFMQARLCPCNGGE